MEVFSEASSLVRTHPVRLYSKVYMKSCHQEESKSKQEEEVLVFLGSRIKIKKAFSHLLTADRMQHSLHPITSILMM